MANQKTLLNLVHDNMAMGCVRTMQDNSLILSVLPFKENNGSMTHLYSVVKSGINVGFREIGEQSINRLKLFLRGYSKLK